VNKSIVVQIMFYLLDVIDSIMLVSVKTTENASGHKHSKNSCSSCSWHGIVKTRKCITESKISHCPACKITHVDSGIFVPCT